MLGKTWQMNFPGYMGPCVWHLNESFDSFQNVNPDTSDSFQAVQVSAVTVAFARFCLSPSLLWIVWLSPWCTLGNVQVLKVILAPAYGERELIRAADSCLHADFSSRQAAVTQCAVNRPENELASTSVFSPSVGIIFNISLFFFFSIRPLCLCF